MNKERYAMEIESNPLKDYIKDLLKQLQAYKDKEDKLRDKLEKSLDSYDPIENKDDLIRYWCVTDILQTLNEGGKE